MEGRLVNDKYIAQAKTQEEATIKGLNALGIARDEAIITVEHPGKKGFLGIGQKDAVVIVERKEKINIVDELLTSEFDLRLDDNKSDQSKTETKRAQTETKQENLEEAASTTEESEDPKEVKAKEEESKMTVQETTEGRNPADVEIFEEQVKEETQTEEEIVKDDQEAIENIRQYLKEIILAMDISDVEVFTSRVGDDVKYDIETKNAGLVIGRHGKVLNGLQTLAQNHMHQLAHSKINVRVDAEKYRERRKSTVETLAERTADKVIKTNRRVKLDPMPAHERKQIHRYLNRNPKVKTHSEGRDPKRYLVVEPADN